MKFKGWPLLLVTILILILQFTAPARVWTMLLIGLGLLQGLAFYWARRIYQNFHLTRERRFSWAQVGDHVEERFTITNHSFLPVLWVEILDGSTMPGYSASQVTGLGTHHSLRWHTVGVCTRRGIFQLGPTIVNLGDPFGLFSIQQIYPNTVDFTVFPPVLPMPTVEIATRGHLGEETPRPYSLAPTEPTATVRDYRPGDGLNHIHWPTTARRESFYVRGMQETTAGDWWLALDLEEKAHRGSDEDSTLEKAVLVASSLADRGLKSGQAVGLLAQGQKSVWLPPKSIALQRWQIMATLAEIQAGQLSLAELLRRGNVLVKQNTSLIIITASTEPDWFDPLLLLRRQGVVPTVLLVYNEDTQATHQQMQHALAGEAIRAFLLDQAGLIVPQADEHAGTWSWRVLGTGRVVIRDRPEGEWKTV